MRDSNSINFDQPIEELQSCYATESRRLIQIEERLGTRSEEEDDIEKARKIAHILHNLQLIINLSDPRQSAAAKKDAQ